MAETYDIIFENEPIGTARTEKAGLYIQFSCRCRLPDQGLYRIHVICGENREDLGICVPMNDAFGMDKKVPAKRVGEGTMSFELLPKVWKPQQEVILQPTAPVEEEIPVLESPAHAEEENSVPEPEEEMFIPVSEEEPFEHLDKLEHALLAERDDKPGILLQDTAD